MHVSQPHPPFTPYPLKPIEIAAPWRPVKSQKLSPPVCFAEYWKNNIILHCISISLFRATPHFLIVTLLTPFFLLKKSTPGVLYTSPSVYHPSAPDGWHCQPRRSMKIVLKRPISPWWVTSSICLVIYINWRTQVHPAIFSWFSCFLMKMFVPIFISTEPCHLRVAISPIFSLYSCLKYNRIWHSSFSILHFESEHTIALISHYLSDNAFRIIYGLWMSTTHVTAAFVFGRDFCRSRFLHSVSSLGDIRLDCRVSEVLVIWDGELCHHRVPLLDFRRCIF